MNDLYVVDVDRYRELVKDAQRRLGALPPFDVAVDRITLGRASGVDLALSYLDECVVAKADGDAGSAGAVRVEDE